MAKPIPDFKSEDEERQFWQEHDSTEYRDWDQAERVVFPNLKLSTIPTEARAERVTFDGHQMHIHLVDRRTISVPLTWIPALPMQSRATSKNIKLVGTVCSFIGTLTTARSMRTCLSLPTCAVGWTRLMLWQAARGVQATQIQQVA